MKKRYIKERTYEVEKLDKDGVICRDEQRGLTLKIPYNEVMESKFLMDYFRKRNSMKISLKLEMLTEVTHDPFTNKNKYKLLETNVLEIKVPINDRRFDYIENNIEDILKNYKEPDLVKGISWKLAENYNELSKIKDPILDIERYEMLKYQTDYLENKLKPLMDNEHLLDKLAKKIENIKHFSNINDITDVNIINVNKNITLEKIKDMLDILIEKQNVLPNQKLFLLNVCENIINKTNDEKFKEIKKVIEKLDNYDYIKELTKEINNDLYKIGEVENKGKDERIEDDLRIIKNIEENNKKTRGKLI